MTGWVSRLALLLALAFGVLSPVRPAPQTAESEEVAGGESEEAEESAHARGPARLARRGHRPTGPAPVSVVLAARGGDTRTGDPYVARPRWLRPRRVSVPDDDDPLG